MLREIRHISELLCSKDNLRHIADGLGLAHGVGYHARNISSDIRKISFLTSDKFTLKRKVVKSSI